MWWTRRRSRKNFWSCHSRSSTFLLSCGCVGLKAILLMDNMVMRLCLLIIKLFVLARGVQSHGSCRESKLCCPGRDSNCIVYTDTSLFSNTVLSDEQLKSARPCYCDHACLKVGDCCDDFQLVCGVNHCEVSDWGPWSECNTACGTGVMTRERSIIRSATNGGNPCPELLQKRSCHGSKCDGITRHVNAHRETAMILPATFSNIRHANETNDIRRNLRLRYRKDPAEENIKEYCVVFETTKNTKTCKNLGAELAPKLATGARICVRCETAAMRKHLGHRCQGHGMDHKTTRFTFLAVPQCHGRWQRMEILEICNCYSDSRADFIFV